MRGKATFTAALKVHGGITPAYAGKRDSVRCSSGFRRDHPRLCGEKPEHGKICLLLMGSPPPMRGKAIFGALFEYKHRITPAYAGKSGYFGIYQYINGDHPRLCGEKRPFFLRDNPSVGSPPPMRGKVAKTADLTDSSRITPAYAGKSVGGKSVT